ncbi:MAG: hypothetical protein GXP55_18860 [Deltaproteobacteria bacterium]|nr:hypothetical protein [Deltaproteobacteria bacterium]
MHSSIRDSGTDSPSAEPDACTTTPEICNGLDDNCDGRIDEDTCTGRAVAVTTGGGGAQGMTTCAVLSDGTVACWGSNQDGAIGLGVPGPDVRFPTRLPGLEDVVDVGVGGYAECVRKRSGEIVCWGEVDHPGAPPDPEPPRVYDGLGPASQMSVTSSGLCTVVPEYTVMCSGYIVGPLTRGPLWSPEGLVEPVQVSVTPSNACVVERRGTVQCWGRNWYGELGDGSVADPTSGNRVTPGLVQDLNDAIQVSVGGGSVCALRAGHTVVCWGPRFGAADPYSVLRTVPEVVPGLMDVTSISSGEMHTCALLRSGSIRCWGENREGQLGDGTTRRSVDPVLVVGLDDAVSISCGWETTCAVRATGQVMCWGNNRNGAIGVPGRPSVLVPTLVPLP